MTIFLWILQSFLALVFMYSGISKSIFYEKKLVSMGMTGMEGVPLIITRFIGITEILGAIGILAPMIVSVCPSLVFISAACFAVIMIPAALIHAKRRESKNVIFNSILFVLCLLVMYGRANVLSC